MEHKHNYNAIDLAKFICSIMVVALHVAPFGPKVEEGSVAYFLNYFIQHYITRLAVPFFFTCSGFFLFRKISQDSFSFAPVKKYVLKILRLYVIWTILYAFLQKWEIKHKTLLYIRNVIFTGSYGHLWYYPALIFAVLLVSFLLYKKMRPRTIVLIAGAFYGAGLLAQSWFGLIVPLRESAPAVWSVLKGIQAIIDTTRNGLFNGFLFVGLGMLFAYRKISISKKQSLWGFVISFILLGIEAYTVKGLNFCREHDMYIFLVPATLFGFSFISQVSLQNNPIYGDLRALSSIIFLLHLRIYRTVFNALKTSSLALADSGVTFVLTLLGTLLVGIVLLALSKIPILKWLKKLWG